MQRHQRDRLRLFLFLVINIKLRPFSLVQLNDMENLSLITSIISIYCGIFYLSDKGSDSSTGEDELVLSSGTKTLLFMMIVISNLIFILHWLSKMFSEARNILRTKC